MSPPDKGCSLLPLLCIALLTALSASTAVVEAAANAPALVDAPHTGRCGRDATPYLAAKILQLRDFPRNKVKFEKLEKLILIFEEEVGGGNFTSLRACTESTTWSPESLSNLTVCLQRACIEAWFGEDEADNVYTIIAEALENRCYTKEWEDEEEEGVPWQTSVGYGTAFAAIVVAGSQFGGLLYPFRKHIIYKVVLTYLIGLACGTLAGGGVLHLMPASLDLAERQPDHKYVYRAAMILGGAYLFYWVERLLRDISKWNKQRKNNDRQVKRREQLRESNKKLLNGADTIREEDGAPTSGNNRKVSIENKVGAAGVEAAENGRAATTLTSEELLKDLMESKKNNNETGSENKFEVRQRLPSLSSRSQFETDTQHKEGEVAPIAWILIMAKIFSTFIDGLSMGAAFTDTIPMGIKIGIAIICEEYPHELGDIAVLLNSGMNFKRALLWNFIAASAVFPGVYVGILAGGTSDANPWIFAIAAGMFVYIALVDMIPELNNLGEELHNSGVHYAIVTFIQHLGLFSGFMLMFCMAVWGDEIGT